jgi:hypothetical protein
VLTSFSLPVSAQPLNLIERVFRWCASVQLAIILVAALIIALALGTWLESRAGAAVARAHVYQSLWLKGLLALLAINVMASALIRYPWSRHQAGFVITHIGIEVLLAGSLIGSRSGYEAQVHLAPGQSASAAQVETDRLLVAMPSADGKPVGYEIPLNLWSYTTWNGHWSANQELPLPQTGEAKLRIVDWLPSAKINPKETSTFMEAPVSPADLPHAMKAVRVEIDSDGRQVRTWLGQGSVNSIEIPSGTMQIAYAPAERALPFDLTVVGVHRTSELASGPVGYAVDVAFTPNGGLGGRQSVQINQPATFDGVSVFAGGVDEHNAAGPMATLDIRTDPGRSLKYIGGVLIVAGTIGVFTFGSNRVSRRRAKSSVNRHPRTLTVAA